MAPNRWVVSRAGRSNSGNGGGLSYGTYAVEDASSASRQICKRESAGSSRRVLKNESFGVRWSADRLVRGLRVSG